MPEMPVPQWGNLVEVDEITRTITVTHEAFEKLHKLPFIQQSLKTVNGVRFKVANRYNFQECANYANECLEEKGSDE